MMEHNKILLVCEYGNWDGTQYLTNTYDSIEDLEKEVFPIFLNYDSDLHPDGGRFFTYQIFNAPERADLEQQVERNYVEYIAGQNEKKAFENKQKKLRELINTRDKAAREADSLMKEVVVETEKNKCIHLKNDICDLVTSVVTTDPSKMYVGSAEQYECLGLGNGCPKGFKYERKVTGEKENATT